MIDVSLSMAVFRERFLIVGLSVGNTVDLPLRFPSKLVRLDTVDTVEYTDGDKKANKCNTD